MKKIIFCIALAIASLQVSIAQNLSNLVADFANSENIHYQLIDRATIEASIKNANELDPTGTLASQIPPFMNKLDSIVIVDLTPCSQDVKNQFIERFNSIENGNNDGYETFLSDSDATDRVRIMGKKNEDIISEIIVLAIDNKNNEIAIVKMAGKIDESDIDDIVKQQTK